jgi:GDPmannose 4,6-dehydratase
MKKALILGAEGQDGVFLHNHLLSQGYEVKGTVKDLTRIPKNIRADKLDFLTLDIIKTADFIEIVKGYQPDEIYNLAGISSVSASFRNPDLCLETNYHAVERMLQSLVNMKYSKKFYQASSSEMFGSFDGIANESTDFSPVSPYGRAKSLAHKSCLRFRKEFGVETYCGILFNHESEFRPKSYVSRKITSSLVEIHKGAIDKFALGNIFISRDWGYAGDYAAAMHMITQCLSEHVFVVATGHSRTLQEFIRYGLDILKMGGDTMDYVSIDPALYRPEDLRRSAGDPTKIREMLGWLPQVSFGEMVERMIAVDL